MNDFGQKWGEHVHPIPPRGNATDPIYCKRSLGSKVTELHMYQHKIQIAITPLRIVRFRSHFGTEFHHVTGDTLQ